MHVIVWRFRANPERRADFVAAYGPDGDWARLFRRGEGYIGTELLADRADPNTFLCIDRWRSEADFAAFKQLHGDAYRALDQRCEALTVEEIPLGSYKV
jgi:heme-degrading monooxygenase HmoA